MFDVAEFEKSLENLQFHYMKTFYNFISNFKSTFFPRGWHRRHRQSQTITARELSHRVAATQGWAQRELEALSPSTTNLTLKFIERGIEIKEEASTKEIFTFRRIYGFHFEDEWKISVSGRIFVFDIFPRRLLLSIFITPDNGGGEKQENNT